MAKIAEIIKRLKEDVPTELISSKKVGNSKIDYISWFDYCDLLDERCGIGYWSWEIKQTTISDNRLFLIGKLTIIGDDRSLSQDATGTEILNCSSYGDPSSNSEAMALRRACAKFGLARYLWNKETTKTQTNQQETKNTAKGEISREQWLAKFGKTANQA